MTLFESWNWKPRLRPTLFIALAFLLCTIVGTLSHEGGHFGVAYALGGTPILHYSSVSFARRPVDTTRPVVRHSRAEVESYRRRHMLYTMLTRIGGPAQTILTGIVGITMLAIRRRKRMGSSFNGGDWVSLFMGLFLLTSWDSSF